MFDQTQRDLEQVTQLEPLVQEFLKEPLSDQARKAQDLTLTFSSIGVAVGLGIVEIEKIGGVAEVKILGNSAAIVATVLSLFFLLRFLLYYFRDRTLFNWAKGRAALGVKIFFREFDEASSSEVLVEVSKRYRLSHSSFFKTIGVIERSAEFRRWMDFVFPIVLWIAAICLLLLRVCR